MQIVHPDLGIVVIATVSEGVNGCDLAVGRIKLDFRYAPSIVGVSCDGLSILVKNSNDIALQIFEEIIGSTVVDNTANAVLVVIERNKSIAIPSFTENLSAVKGIFVLNAVDSLARSYAVCVVGICIRVVRLKLPTLFPKLAYNFRIIIPFLSKKSIKTPHLRMKCGEKYIRRIT